MQLIKHSLTEIYCGSPGFIRNGFILGHDFHYNSKVTYRCYDTFTLIGANSSTCSEDGQWHPTKPTCQGPQCVAFKKPPDSELTILSDQIYEDSTTHQTVFESGTQIDISCVGNATLTGESLLTCLDSGEWDFEPPTCTPEKKSVQLPCSLEQIPAAPAHGYVVLESLYAAGNGTGVQVEYRCRFGYQLRGDAFAVCILDGYWTEPNATCERKQAVYIVF